jgi:hypothetical protein
MHVGLHVKIHVGNARDILLYHYEWKIKVDYAEHKREIIQ